MKTSHARIIIKAPQVYITMQVVEFKMHYDTMNAKRANSPSKQANRTNNPQFSPQIGKTRRIKSFSENICDLLLGLYKVKHDITLLNIVSKEMISDVNVFSPRVLHWVFGYVNGRSVVTEKRNTTQR